MTVSGMTVNLNLFFLSKDFLYFWIIIQRAGLARKFSQSQSVQNIYYDYRNKMNNIKTGIQMFRSRMFRSHAEVSLPEISLPDVSLPRACVVFFVCVCVSLSPFPILKSCFFCASLSYSMLN